MEVAAHNKVDDHFQPYSWNGGSILAIAGEDYVTIASDNRISEGFLIHSRNEPKIARVTDNVYIAVCGFCGDALAFVKHLEAKVKYYQINHKKKMSVEAVAQMISNMLYYRRFFPYYVYVILSGIDSHGRGAVYSYDPVGSYERVLCRSAGSAASIIQPILDNQISLKNVNNSRSFLGDKDSVVKFIHDVFSSAAERDIYTGDGVSVLTLTAGQVHTDSFSLRQD